MPAQPSTASASQRSSDGPAPGGPQPPRVRNARRTEPFSKLDQFWNKVTEGLQLSDLWSQFKQEAQSGYRFYQRDYEAAAPAGQTKRGKFFERAQLLMWAILNKLSPARRVLLLIGVVLLILPSGGVQFHAKNEVQITTPNFQFWGGLALFVLLMLEIADRVVMKRDLEIARDIQSWLLPTTLPLVPGLTIAFATRPANTV